MLYDDYVVRQFDTTFLREGGVRGPEIVL